MLLKLNIEIITSATAVSSMLLSYGTNINEKSLFDSQIGVTSRNEGKFTCRFKIG